MIKTNYNTGYTKGEIELPGGKPWFFKMSGQFSKKKTIEILKMTYKEFKLIKYETTNNSI